MTRSPSNTSSDIAILGAGPVGLEAAATACAGAVTVTVFERGQIAEHMLDWGHVELFTPSRMNIGPSGRRVTARLDVPLPRDKQTMSGRDFRERYLLPLADGLRDEVRFETSTRVITVGRKHLLKGEAIAEDRRAEDGFRILYERDGRERVHEARVVLDCTGTFSTPAWFGPGGAPALGERQLRRAVTYRIPDVLGDDKWHYAVRRTLVIGSGHSAATSVLLLAQLASTEDGTRVHWVTRGETGAPVARIPDDPLPARALLTDRVNGLAFSSPAYLTWEGGTDVIEIRRADEQAPFSVTLRGKYATRTQEFDRIIANVGYEPDDSLYRQLQIHECYASRAPMKVAAALLAAGGDGPADCLALGGFGPDVLENPEPGYFILGAKSFGKQSAFLLQTGYQQVADVFRLLERKGIIKRAAGLSLLK